MGAEPNPLAVFCGIPYRWGGRTRYGVDCWGLVALVYQVLKKVELRAIHDLDPADLSAIAERFAWERRLYLGRADFTPSAEPDYLDIVEMAPERRHLPFHVGVFASGHVLHSRRRVGSILTPIAELAPRIRGFYRHAAD